MSIVFITIPGEQKKQFANELNQITGGGVSYVIIQKTRRVSMLEKFKKLLKTVGWKNILKEFYFVVYIRLHADYRNYLKYFFNWTKKGAVENFQPKVIEVDSVNSDEVYKLLQEIKPKLIVVWGSNILQSRIFKSAENAINLHMGLGEYYRGAVANHYAILEDKREAIGAMIHKIDEKTDTGDIYKTISADLNLPPKELFIKLNDQAFAELLDISNRLMRGGDLQSRHQDLSKSKNILLREYIPSRRFVVAKKLKEWEREFHGSSR